MQNDRKGDVCQKQQTKERLLREVVEAFVGRGIAAADIEWHLRPTQRERHAFVKISG